MDDRQVAERILDYLEQLGSTLADLAPDAKRIAMQAVYADAVTEVFLAIGFILAAGLLVWVGYRLRRGTYDGWSQGDKEFAQIAGWAAPIFGAIVAILALVPLSNLVEIIIAPEYSALRKIVGIVTGCD